MSSEITLPQNIDTHCTSCGQEKPELKKCSKCMSVSYCGRECQIKDWGTHKTLCSQYEQLRKKTILSQDQKRKEEEKKKEQPASEPASEQTSDPKNQTPNDQSNSSQPPQDDDDEESQLSGPQILAVYRIMHPSGSTDVMDSQATLPINIKWSTLYKLLARKFHIAQDNLRLWYEVPRDYQPAEKEKTSYSGPFRFKAVDPNSNKSLKDDNITKITRMMFELRESSDVPFPKDKPDIDISNLNLSDEEEEEEEESGPMGGMGMGGMGGMGMGGMGGMFGFMDPRMAAMFGMGGMRMKTAEERERDELKKVLKASYREEQQRIEKEKKEKEEKERIEKEQEEMKQFAQQSLKQSQSTEQFVHEEEDDDHDLESLMKKHQNDSDEDEEEEEEYEYEEEE